MHTGRYVHAVVRERNAIIVRLAGQTTIPTNQSLAGSAEVILDSIQYPPSGSWGISMYPFYRWEIRVELAGGPKVSATFPLTVERGISPDSSVSGGPSQLSRLVQFIDAHVRTSLIP